MKVSLNWVRYYNELYKMSADSAPKGVGVLVEKIGLQLGAVEEVTDLGKKYRGIVIVKVVSCTKHPNADKLSVCLVDDKKTVKSVKRTKDGFVEVVCGAPNVKAGMLVAWIPSGSTVPSTFDREPFVIEARQIRGVVSNGMLASTKELDLGDDHSGILEMDEDAKPGADFAKSYGLDDYIIDIENKMFTHRPDLFGQLGVAREIAGIQGHVFKSPEWYREDASIEKSRARDDHKLLLKNEAPRLVSRFSAAVIKDVSVKPSPVWLRSYIARVGAKPINNIVDLTNYYMLFSAQPLHAYDYDKVLGLQKDQKHGVKIGVRLSKKGEELKLLGGKQLKLDAGAVVITANDIPIGLGGVMGGADTEVDENTKNVILESANFDMNITRKTAMRYGLFTDAATRFTKGQSPLQTMAVLSKTADDVMRLAGGRVSAVVDNAQKSNPRFERASVRTSSHFINSRLGLSLSQPQIKKLLENVEFEVNQPAGSMIITSPFWRTDIEIPEDIVEEVGRLYGYEHLPQVLPKKDLAPPPASQMLDFKAKLRSLMAAAGANEILTYSFVSGKLLDAAGQDKKRAYKIVNALSPDLQYCRLSLTPSLLEKIHPNIKAGVDLLVLYEIGKGHVKNLVGKDKLPLELERLSLVIASKEPQAGAPYYAAKRLLEYLLDELGIGTVQYQPLDTSADYTTVTYYESARGANLVTDGRTIGRIGEFKQSVKAGFKLPEYCAGFDIHTDELLKLAAPPAYQPLNRFPSLDQDLCLKAPARLSYDQLTSFIYAFLDTASAKHGYIGTIRPLDIFQKKTDKSHKQTTWRITLAHPERTLTTQVANKLLDELSAKAKKQLGAERV